MNRFDTQPLVQLGLTQLEAEIYTFLLENSPATGYKIAKGLSKPAPNTYKALESLHQKGAIIIDDSKTRLCRAVSKEELLDSFQRSFESTKKRAEIEFEKLQSSPSDSRIYQLKSINQLISRYRSLLSTCKRVVVLDLFPIVANLLKDDIIAASNRGVNITIKVYEAIELPNVNLFIEHNGKKTVKKWPGMWANGVFDGEEYLLAYLTKDGQQVIQAVWSNNCYLSWVYYGGFISELMSSALQEGLEQNATKKELKEIISRFNKMLKLEFTGFVNAASFFENK